MNQKKKVCIAITQAEMGGAQVYVRDLAINLDKAIYDITIAHGEQQHDWLDQEAAKHNIPVYYFKHLKRNIRPFKEIRAFFELYTFFKKEKFDAVHLNSSKTGIIGIPAARLAGVAIILFNAHGWAYDDPRPFYERWLYILAYFLTTPLLSKLICISDYARRTGIAHGLSPKKLVMIHNGIDTKSIKLLPKEEARVFLTKTYNLQPTTYLIGTVANFYPTKGLLYLLQAAKEMVTENKQIHFCLIGYGEQETKLREFITKNNLEKNVSLITDLRPAVVYLRGLDLFAMSSLREGFPYALLEAMIAGLPIVTTDVGGNREVLAYYPESHYTLVPSKNPSALANEISTLLSTPHLSDTEIAHVAEQIDIKNMIKKTNELLR